MLQSTEFSTASSPSPSEPHVVEPNPVGRGARQAEINSAVALACSRIAPTWPLDQFIAVNPFWGWIDHTLAEANARLSALSGTRLIMPRSWFRSAYQEGRLQDEHIISAIVEEGAVISLTHLLRLMSSSEPITRRRDQVVDLVDRLSSDPVRPSWHEFITNSVSQFCAAYFDEVQASTKPDRTGGLYASWLRRATLDPAPALQMNARDYNSLASALPLDAASLIESALIELSIPPEEYESYTLAMLLDLNGWSSWCAYRRWSAGLEGGSDDTIVDLLAIRLSYELILYRRERGLLVTRWTQSMARWPSIDEEARQAMEHDWLLQRAMEVSYRAPTCASICEGLAVEEELSPISAQAVFCIDVRSETFRRALEQQSNKITTLGFAGFFGLPVDYQPAGTIGARPQLPGLLAPKIRVSDVGISEAGLAQRRRGLLGDRLRGSFRSGPLSSFAFVEAMGLSYASKLVVDSLGLGSKPALDDSGLSRRDDCRRKPRLFHTSTGDALTQEAKSDLACGMLKAMSLTKGHARIILLVGHGSETRNNPHAGGLHCGACGGQTGEVNARAAAALLNEPQVRHGLSERGIELPSSSHFVAALHNTTTDEVALFDLDEVPLSHRDDIETLRQDLRAAGHVARRERARSLAIEADQPGPLLRAVKSRARDWAQVRPEWGLANNAVFIVAPREVSKHMALAGRSFLHDYREEDDENGSILELIMTAPMVVTHWINLQYYASTVDPRRYGSGNKVLHNVVGGRVGVFEGNTGDLRIGLPLQSLHDGARFMHSPLRLTVMIAASREAICSVLAKHEHVRNLVDNGWLSLVQLCRQTSTAWNYHHGAWVKFESQPKP